jgi:spermidine/putrescine transport system substrate-binding protein
MASQINPGLAAQFAIARTSRRRFIGGSAAAAAALAFGGVTLAACGSKSTPASSSTSSAPADDGKPATGNLRISNWPLYMADGFVAAFQKASGLTVDYKEDFNDNEEWFAKNKEPLSRKQDIGADLVVPTQFMALRLKGLNWLNEISDTRVPNKKNLRPDLLSNPAASSPPRTCPA